MKFKWILSIVEMTFMSFFICQSQVKYRIDWPKITNLDTTIVIDAFLEKIYHKIPILI